MPDQTDVVTTVATAGLQAFGLSGLALNAVLTAVVEDAIATLPDTATTEQAENAAAVSVANFAASPHRTHGIRAEPSPPENQLDALVQRFPTIMSLSPTNRLMLARQFENEQTAAASRKPAKAKAAPPSIADMERLHPDFSALSPIAKLARINGEIARRARGG